MNPALFIYEPIFAFVLLTRTIPSPPALAVKLTRTAVFGNPRNYILDWINNAVFILVILNFALSKVMIVGLLFFSPQEIFLDRLLMIEKGR